SAISLMTASTALLKSHRITCIQAPPFPPQIGGGRKVLLYMYSLEIQFLLKRNYIFSNFNFTIIGQSKKVLHLALLFVRMSGQMNERMR
ncbi:MAG TPA: hypothetical protein DCL24_01525, partial [Erysipelotrichaceae bacterium]|nr:hypothetical protein [Erysipelotrichaceae bacterium]